MRQRAIFSLVAHSATLKRITASQSASVAPSGATAEFYRSRGMQNPPEFGPLAAVTPGTPGGLMTMLAEYGTHEQKERFLADVPAEERDILRGALLRRRPAPLVRTYLGKSKAAG